MLGSGGQKGSPYVKVHRSACSGVEQDVLAHAIFRYYTVGKLVFRIVEPSEAVGCKHT